MIHKLCQFKNLLASSYLKCLYTCDPNETCSMNKLACNVERDLSESTEDENTKEPTGWIDSSSILNDPFISQVRFQTFFFPPKRGYCIVTLQKYVL